MEATNKNDNDKCIMSGATFNEMKRRFDAYSEMLLFVKKELSWLQHIQKDESISSSIKLGIGQAIKQAEKLIKQIEGK